MERLPFHRMGAVFFIAYGAYIKISTFGSLICKKYLWVEPLLVTAGGCNDGCLLPKAPGRVWYGADINYYSDKRNRHRLLWFNDGLIL